MSLKMGFVLCCCFLQKAVGLFAFSGVINQPVVDLALHANVFSGSLTSLISASPNNSPLSFSPRPHQGLFNEHVTVISVVENDVAEVAFDNLAYALGSKMGEPINFFFVPLAFITDISALNSLQKKAVPPKNRTNGLVVILVKPWNGYSFGTRFVIDQELCKENDSMVPVFVLQQGMLNIVFVPRDCVIEEQILDVEEQRSLFVWLAYALLRDAESQGGVVPYVWGGSSYVDAYSDAFKNSAFGWVRERATFAYSGFDCSELVFRLARMVGSSYIGKVSALAPKLLPEVPDNEPVRAGDLIWIPGHLMIVGDTQKNELIEARSYSSGFGCVHKISVAGLFKDVDTFEDLRAAGKMGQKLSLLNRAGAVVLEVEKLVFLRLFADKGCCS